MFSLICALAIRRSEMAALTVAARSGDSQNTWIDTRGTGSICATGRSIGGPSSVPLPA
jgi:hypothetical protein